MEERSNVNRRLGFFKTGDEGEYTISAIDDGVYDWKYLSAVLVVFLTLAAFELRSAATF